MFVVAAKAGLGFAVILSILGVVQAHSPVEPVLLFVTIGLIPGTELVMPPEMLLLIVAAALMLITVLFFRRYNAYHATLDAIMPEYVRRNDREDPDYGSLVPGLGRLVVAGRTAMSAINDASLEFYFWLRSLGRPTIAQTITVRRGLGTAFVRFDRTVTRARLREEAEAVGIRLQTWSRESVVKANELADKAREYFVRYISSSW